MTSIYDSMEDGIYVYDVWSGMILATSSWLGFYLLQALQTAPQLPFPSNSSQEIIQGVPYNFLTLICLLLFISLFILTQLKNKNHIDYLHQIKQSHNVYQGASINNFSIILCITYIVLGSKRDRGINLLVLCFMLVINYYIYYLTTAMSRFNTTIPTNHDNKKIYCAYHPSEYLTNFCCDAHCLMPLCPNCIVEHTEQHFLENNKPCYVNIIDIIQDTKQKCYQNIVIFQQLNRSNDKILDYLMGMKESIHNQLFEDKQHLFQMIDQMFDNYQEKLYSETVAKYKELEVYDKNQTENISQFIGVQIQTLHNQIGLLKGENCLAGLITYYANDGKVYEDSIREITDYIQKHRVAGKIYITSNQESLTSTLTNFCQNNLTIQFFGESSLKDKEEESKLKESKMLNKEGKIFQTKNSKFVQSKPTESVNKENFIDNSNEYRNTHKKAEEYYKIDTNQMKSSKAANNSIHRNLLNSHKQSLFRHQA